MGLEGGGGDLLVGELQFVEVGLEFFLGGLVAFGLVGFQNFQDVGGELGAALGGEAFLGGRENGGELLLRFGGFGVGRGVVFTPEDGLVSPVFCGVCCLLCLADAAR